MKREDGKDGPKSVTVTPFIIRVVTFGVPAFTMAPGVFFKALQETDEILGEMRGHLRGKIGPFFGPN